MDKYIMFQEGEKITIQESEYIEDGCYIEVISREIILYEIPSGGGQEQKVGRFDTVLDAINYSKKLT